MTWEDARGNYITEGSKVKCIYYHEHLHEAKKYNRPRIQKILDRPFSPVKYGVVVKSAGVHPYWLATGVGGMEEYLFVRFKEYMFLKAIPLSCCFEAAECLKHDKEFLLSNIHRVGEPGFGIDSFRELGNIMRNGEAFIYKK